jgi:hypothetical protein
MKVERFVSRAVFDFHFFPPNSCTQCLVIPKTKKYMQLCSRVVIVRISVQIRKKIPKKLTFSTLPHATGQNGWNYLMSNECWSVLEPRLYQGRNLVFPPKQKKSKIASQSFFSSPLPFQATQHAQGHMKFKAGIRDAKTFTGICSTHRSFHKRTIVKLHPHRIRFITSTPFSDGSQVWTSCRTDSLFADSIIESKNDNAVYVEITDLAQVLQSMRSAEKSCNVVMKLAKVDVRQLLKVSMQHLQTHHDISFDIAVRVLTETEIQNIVAPPLEDRVLHVELPSLAELSVFVERVRSAGCLVIQIDAEVAVPVRGPVPSKGAVTQCNLTWKADSTHACFSAKYQGLLLAPSGASAHGEDEEDLEEEPLRTASVMIDAKKIQRVLNVRGVCPTKVIAHIVPGKALVLSAYAVGDTNLVVYLPNVFQ